MDDKGYTFTPMAVLLFIPIIIVAITYGSIVTELNTLAGIPTGGTVTYTTANNIISNIENGAGDAGRNASSNATRKVINENKFFDNGKSKEFIAQNTAAILNAYIITSTLSLKNETGREIYINGTPIENYNQDTFSNVAITQTDPYGFYVTLNGGVPLKVVQKDQVFETKTPPITTYVSIQGLEDPYVFRYTKGSSNTSRFSNVFYKYPYYTTGALGPEYHFNDSVDTNNVRLYQLWNCLYGTDNPSGLSPRPYYFPDTNGLSFFDRLEGKNSSSDDSATRMSTFILGDPLQEDHGRRDISRLDHEYIASTIASPNIGTPIRIGNEPMIDPLGSVFYLSSFYKNLFKLS
jgi:hypothetical protein